MSRFFRMTLCCVLALASCTQEETPHTSSAPALRTGTDLVEESPKENMGVEAGVAIVYLDDSFAAQAERGKGISRLPEQMKVTSMTRLFPDAGEWEPRTRAAGLHRWYVVEFDKTFSTAKALACLKELPGISRVEASRVVRPQVNISDPYWGQMWGVNNTAHPGYDVNAKAVWDAYGTMGNASVTVAVVDGGIQVDHPDLKANIALSGHYNYVTGSEGINAIVQHDHGTHVAGTIAAVGNNGIGVIGVAGGDAAAGKPGVKLLSLQVFQTNQYGQDVAASNFARAIKEGADRGAVISQNSWGNYFDFNDDGVISGYELEYARSAHENPESSFVQAVEYFNKYAGCDNDGNQLPDSPMKGGVVIFAAGNDNLQYGSPGNYEGCISVGAINSNGSRASFSNFGDWVDICAPGVGIYSTFINSGYQSYSGTSMACPHVSGVAALIVSHFGGQGFTAEELRTRLIQGARNIAPSTGNKPIGPLVDAFGSFQLNSSGNGAPDKVTSVSVVPVGHNLRVDFKAVEAYGYIALASRKSSALETVDYANPGNDVVSATKVLMNAEAGSDQSIQLSGLTPDKDYYVTVVAFSYDKKYSGQSNAVLAHTAVNQAPDIDIPDYPSTGFVFEHYQSVSLPIRVSDPDGDNVTVSILNSGNGRATLEANNGSQSLYNFGLLCSILQPKTYQAIITAVDELGEKRTMTVNYTVKANTEPAIIAEPPVALLEGVGKEYTLDMSTVIGDADGEPLVYKASSTDRNVADVRVEDNLLKVVSVAKGVCKVKITATDHDDKKAVAEFSVLVKPEGVGEVFLATEPVLSGGEVTIVPGVEESPTTIRIISSSGVVIYEHTGIHSVNSPLTYNVDHLAPGIYTFEVTYKGQVYTFTIVKQ